VLQSLALHRARSARPAPGHSRPVNAERAAIASVVAAQAVIDGSKGSDSVTFSEMDNATSPVAATRLKRQLAEQAIAQAAGGHWSDAADTNRRLLELGADAEAENRLAKALWELGELGEAREHYQAALALDPTNRIAERNIDRLRTLLVAAGERTVAAQDGSKAPVRIFVEETGKTGFAYLIDLADPRKLAQVNPGDAVELTPEGNVLVAFSNGVRIGVVEPRVAARLLKLIADGNKYSAGVTSLGAVDVRIIIREIYQDPRNYGKVSFPTAAKSTDMRPYTKGTLVREDEELEDELEDDIEDEEIEDLDRVLPPEDTTDEAFEEENDDLEES
jgi:tetratricopeptide (TPR) repeat protein